MVPTVGEVSKMEISGFDELMGLDWIIVMYVSEVQYTTTFRSIRIQEVREVLHNLII